MVNSDMEIAQLNKSCACDDDACVLECDIIHKENNNSTMQINKIPLQNLVSL